MAAVLACGPGAALSHRAAAQLRGLIHFDAGRPAVSVPAGRFPRRPGIAVHRIQRVEPELVDAIPCTPVARTIVDMAGISRRRTLEKVVEEAHVLETFDLRAIHDTARHHRAASGRAAAALGARGPPARNHAHAHRPRGGHAGALPPRRAARRRSSTSTSRSPAARSSPSTSTGRGSASSSRPTPTATTPRIPSAGATAPRTARCSSPAGSSSGSRRRISRAAPTPSSPTSAPPSRVEWTVEPAMRTRTVHSTAGEPGRWPGRVSRGARRG